MSYYYNAFNLKFLFILFFFSCEFNTQKIPNIDALKKNASSTITINTQKNNKKLYRNKNVHII
ncbi:hypothetical protein BOM_1198 (plasmid) [Borrelia miyamotoi FR64b]|uniref:Uncharacterized protein n=1 Tax=Borrelia miyamotoi FR64b TaxID=1292392 RepID=W5SKX4_9SPIR|nr:hypothetical protein BOM_1198 [Borrelia miyamotoi FR64b]